MSSSAPRTPPAFGASGTLGKVWTTSDMIGNNLSTLGVSAAQLNNYFKTNVYCARLDADDR